MKTHSQRSERERGAETVIECYCGEEFSGDKIEAQEKFNEHLREVYQAQVGCEYP